MPGLTDADRRWGTARAGQPTPRAPGRAPWMPPQEQRHHYVFLRSCGCPFGLIEASPNRPDGPPRLANEDAAWHGFYDTRAEERAARARGVRAVHVDHATYIRDFYNQMSSKYRCPHGST